MAYFIHNKYDSNSSSQVTNVSGTDYTFNSDTTVTVIDYFGLLEKGDETYKYLDTTYMGIQPITELVYTTIDTENLIGSTPTTDGKSNTEYASGISKILDKLQITVGEKADTGGSESDGTVMAKLNAILSGFTSIGAIKSIQRGIVKLNAYGSSSEATDIKININPINPQKSIAFVNGSTGLWQSQLYHTPDTYIEILSPTQIVVSPQWRVNSTSGAADGYAAWQILEFN